MKQTELHLYRSLTNSEKLYSRAIIWLPLLVTVFSIASGMLFDIHLGTLILFLFCYSCTVFGVTVGFHRLLTHHSFKAKRWVKIVFACFGSMAYEGPPFFWIAAHRRHHKYTETEFDPHSPMSVKKGGLRGFYHAHMGWMPHHTIENWRYYLGDLLHDRDLLFINKYYAPIALSGIIIPGVINGLMYMSWYSLWEGIIICGFVRIFVQQHVTWSINSICHIWGKKDFNTQDNSKNNWLLAILAYGEGWHNGHHAFPSSAKHGLKKGQIDVSYLLIFLLLRMGLVQEIKLPTEEQIKQKSIK
ncbi:MULTISPECIES: acyl-CoA desaturase [Legionella]|uniref:Fatty acid desaturase n=1 Tax=Legionella steelei TaxID=947033 RepID=A0A0W0ZKN2_9GAMM|nr:MULTISPECIES: acyl-CoA desaturase [Legionella]KTD69398.1 fatty acid desaturase [Legionella steelei]MBN9226506.1 acyl-CoA desaturase [Legionella steelei]OJW15571.1 MAG: stearoyl-CoA 9-desaturase [Legionella sp. 39-23]